MKTLLTIFLLATLTATAQISPVNPLFTATVFRPSAAAANPSFVREDTRNLETASGATSTIDIQTDITSGQRAVVVVQWVSASQTLDSVTDSDGNTWTVNSTDTINTAINVAICSTVTAATLSSTDTITLNWGTAGFTYRSWGLFVINNSTGGEDVEATGESFGTAISASATTTAATTIIGVVTMDSQSQTYGSSSFTVSGAALDWGASRRSYFVQSDQASSGSKNVDGTLSGNDTWGALWTAYK